MYMFIEKMFMKTPTFKSVPEFTEWLVKQPENYPKVITLRTVFKVTKMKTQPTKNQFGEWLGDVYTEAQIAAFRAKGDGAYYPSIDSVRTIEEGTMFDLNKERDRKDWSWVQWNPAITVDQRIALMYGEVDNPHLAKKWNVEFYVEFPEHTESLELEELDTKIKAINRVNDLAIEDYRKVLNMLNVVVSEKTSPTRMRLLLTKEANQSTESARRVLDILNNSDFEMISLFTDALIEKVIHQENGVYKYEGITLGYSQDMVIEKLKEKTNKGLFDEIFARVRPNVPTSKEDGAAKSRKRATVSTPKSTAVK